MDTAIPTVTALFDQLGLPSDPAAIDTFIAGHGPLPADMPLHEAPFWNPAQATFLREEVQEDSEWAELIEENLNVSLRQQPGSL